jgi:hypothetical protein
MVLILLKVEEMKMVDHEDDKEQKDSNMFLVPDRRENNISSHNNRDDSDPPKGNNVVVDTGEGKGNEDDGDGDRLETKIRFAIFDVEEGDEKADTNEKKEDDDVDDETVSLPKANFFHETSSREYLFVVLLGLTMAFIAGYSNGVCLSGYLHINRTMLTNKQSVAGVTGLYTLSAISLGNGKCSTTRIQL